LEANPGTISEDIAESGVNRISIGVQSIYDRGLQILGRRSHTAEEAIRCVHNISEVFENISIDMIYNRPGQIPEEWNNELLEVVDLFSEKIQHISCYELTIEENTPLGKNVQAGKILQPLDTDEFFDTTHDVLPKNGFEAYEVSNFSKPGFQSKHNLAYWRYEDYFGIGPGAHSRVTLKNEQKLAIEYTDKHELKIEELSENDVLKERVIMGLRAKCGINLTDFPISQEKISRLIENCYVVFENGRIIMTYEGIKRINLVVAYILDSCVV
jgi:oxygen-independent coproporphyrinogen-3 oxidase